MSLSAPLCLSLSLSCSVGVPLSVCLSLCVCFSLSASLHVWVTLVVPEGEVGRRPVPRGQQGEQEAVSGLRFVSVHRADGLDHLEGARRNKSLVRADRHGNQAIATVTMCPITKVMDSSLW